MSLTIAVVGTGYLGATHAACLAELGFEVVGFDTDPAKVARLSQGEPPFYEPDLSALLDRHVSSGRLSFTDDPAVAAATDVQFLCVGTPQRPDGLAADTRQLSAAVAMLVPHLTADSVIVGKSTVPVGTAAALQQQADELSATDLNVEIAWNPEFLREGRAVEDTLRPDRLVFGVASETAEKVLREVYAKLLDDGVPLVVTDVVSAELVKVAANAFLATKVSFVNAIAELCEATGGDVVSVSEALGHDHRIGRSFLTAGLGFGGGCLPKDIRALMARAGELGVDQALTFLREVDAINMRRRDRVVELVLEDLGGSALGRSIAVLGAAFKPQTDDVRDSPALNVAARLQLLGARIRVYDPKAMENASRQFPTLDYVDTADDAVRGADLVLLLTEWEEFLRIDPAVLAGLVRRASIIDARNALDTQRWCEAGWDVRGLGRPRLPAMIGGGAGGR